MGAPDATLLAALRDPQVGVARHLFFELNHSQGYVRVWDGIGEYSLDGNTYLGIGDLASISGVSQSTELQSHSVECRLQGVTLDALRDTDQTIRDDAAKIQILWIDSTNAVLATRTLFEGSGDNLSIEPSEDSIELVCRLRAPIANWARPPSSYYTPSDQALVDADDTGLSFVPLMEQANSAGWSVNEETSGGRPVMYHTFVRQDDAALVWPCYGGRDTLTGRPLGNDTYGVGGPAINLDAAPASPGRRVVLHRNSAGDEYKEQTTGAIVHADQNSELEVAGVNCYIDASGDVRTPGGLEVRQGGGAGAKLRVAAEITSIGTATTDTIGFTDLGGSPDSFLQRPYRLTTAGKGKYAHVTGGAIASGDDFTDAIFCNKRGISAAGVHDLNDKIGFFAASGAGDSQYYKDSGTGVEAAFVSGVLQVSGSDCFISTTGAVITPAGNYLVLDGDDSDAFLRIWT